MYLCLCKGITEEQVKVLLAKGHRGHELLNRLGIGKECGVCILAATSGISSMESSLVPEKNSSSMVQIK